MRLADHIKAKEILGLAAQRDLPCIDITLGRYGARCDGSTAEQEILQAAIDDLPEYGGTIFIPRGSLRTTASVRVTKPNVRIISTGYRNAQDASVAGADIAGPGLIFADHDGSAVVLDSGEEVNGFGMADISLCGNGGTLSRAIQFLKTTNDFRRDHVFERVTITKFGIAYCVETDGIYSGDRAWGALRITKSCITANKWIARTLNGCQINRFAFEDNDAGNNGWEAGHGGIAVNGHAASINRNVLEGTRDPIFIDGAYRGIEIRGNYFESNVGDACIKLHNCSEHDVGPNTFLVVNTDFKVLLRYGGMGRCLDPYMGEAIFKVPFPLSAQNNDRKNKVPASTSAPVYLTWLNDPVYGHDYPVATSKTFTPKEPVWLNSKKSYAHREVIGASDNGDVTQSVAVSAASGKWLCAQFLYRLNDAPPGGSAELDLNINGTSAAGSYDYILGNSVNYIRVGEWVHVVGIIRAHATVTSMDVTLRPFGSNPSNTGEISCDILPLQVCVFDDINDIRPGYSVPEPVTLEDDFITGDGGNANIGKLGWTRTNGAMTHTGESVAGRYGVARRSCAASAGQAASLFFEPGNNRSTFGMSEWDCIEWHAAVVDLDADYKVRFGISADPGNSSGANGVYFERLDADETWFAVCRASGTETRTAMAAVDTSFHKFKLRRTDAGIYFSIDDGAETLVTTNVPGSLGVQPFHQIIPTGATVRSTDIDLMRCYLYPSIR